MGGMCWYWHSQDLVVMTEDAPSSAATQACPKSRDILGVSPSSGMPSP